MIEKVYIVPNPPTPNRVLAFDAQFCNGCNLCVDVCPDDVLMPNPDPRQPPIVVYPEECWYCGACVEECARSGITLLHPTSQRISVNWKRRATGQHFRLGMRNPPPPNNTEPSGTRQPGNRRKKTVTENKRKTA
jgi:NAD-dependent dihydropyrimidine dehydrogenase PreA subunit